MLDLDPIATRPTKTIQFENVEWRLLGDGLEHRATGYFIAREVIGMRRGDLWEWPLHLAEKTWCTPRDFRPAFLAALESFGVHADAGLARSFAIGFGFMASPGNKAASRTGDTDEFVALGELVRPRSTTVTRTVGTPSDRKRVPVGEPRGATRRVGLPSHHPVNELMRQRVTS